MFYCFQNEILLPGTQSFSIFGSGRVGYLKKSSGRVGYRDPVRPWSFVHIAHKCTLHISLCRWQTHAIRVFVLLSRLVLCLEEIEYQWSHKKSLFMVRLTGGFLWLTWVIMNAIFNLVVTHILHARRSLSWCFFFFNWLNLFLDWETADWPEDAKLSGL